MSDHNCLPESEQLAELAEMFVSDHDEEHCCVVAAVQALKARAEAAEAALRERDAEIERLTRERDEWEATAQRCSDAYDEREAESRRLLEQSVETLTAAHVDCPGYEVIAAHDCHGDDEACRRRCPIQERTECQVCKVIEAIRAHLAGGER